MLGGFGGLEEGTLAFGTQAEAVGFFRTIKSPQHAFIRRGSKAVAPRSQICGM
jgi:hypothetical protein